MGRDFHVVLICDGSDAKQEQGRPNDLVQKACGLQQKWNWLLSGRPFSAGLLLRDDEKTYRWNAFIGVGCKDSRRGIGTTDRSHVSDNMW